MDLRFKILGTLVQVCDRSERRPDDFASTGRAEECSLHSVCGARHSKWLLIRLAVVCVSTMSLLACAGPARFPDLGDAIPAGVFLEPSSKEALPQGMSLREISPHGLSVTKISERFVPYLYNDAVGYCTIGYGHLVERSRCNGEEPSEFLSGITEPHASTILTRDMETAEVGVMLLTQSTLSDNQYAALCDFVFNVGVANYRGSTLRGVVNAGEYDRVPTQLRRWIFAGGKELDGLKERREREIDLFFGGLPQARRAPTEGEEVSPVDIRTGEGVKQQ